ncbi:MAG: class II glutamine amidotransferase [Candidatus Sumerlaeaceae bacterium]
MVGFTAAKPVRVGAFLEAVAEQAQHGCQPWGRPHGDGWGMALLTPAGWFVAHSNRPIWEFSLGRLAGVEATSGLVHARLASPNTPVNLTKVHPFCAVIEGQTYAFCHNGSITRRERLPRPANITLATDAIDTEQYFALVQERLACGDSEEEALATTVKDIENVSCEFSSLNALLLSEKKLVAVRGPVDEKYRHYYTIYVHCGPEIVAVSTEPLSAFSESVPLDGIFAAAHGSIATCHPL